MLTAESPPFLPLLSPGHRFLPTYASADDISCKLLSADRISEQLNLPGAKPLTTPPVTCADVNLDAVTRALELLKVLWPAAVDRYNSQGGNPELLRYAFSSTA